MYSNSIKSVLQSYSRLKIQYEGCIDQIRINLLDPDFPIFDLEADSWDGPSRFVNWAVLGIGYTFKYWQVTDWRGVWLVVWFADFIVCLLGACN